MEFGFGAAGGTLEVAGTLSITGDRLASDFGGGLIHVLAGGTLNRSSGTGTTKLQPAVENDGTITIGTGTLAVSSLTQAQGSTTVSGGTTLSGAVTLNGGTLGGSGTVEGSLTNTGGTVAPGGSSPGILTVVGPYTQGAGGTLQIEIDGLTVGTEYDRLAVTGAASLDGTLAIVTGAAFDPPVAAGFTILTASDGGTGTFATITGTDVNGKTYVETYEPNSVTLGVDGPVDVTPPAVTLTSPADGSSTTDTTPTFAGAAGTAPGDLAPITVKVFAGPTATGTPVQTIATAALTGVVGRRRDAALAPGQYTAIAEQSDESGNLGTSAESTFTVVAVGITVSVGDVTVTEGNAGEVDASFPVTLSAASAGTVTVQFDTSDGSAAAPADYTARSSVTVSFDPGQTSQNVVVKVQGDLLDEIDEAFAATLSNPTGATVADGSATGTITDDDGAPSLSIGDQSVTEGNSATTPMTFTVSLSAPSGKTVVVNYSTTPGSASVPGDVLDASGQLTFAPGDTSETITVSVVGDLTDEPDEMFSLTLASPQNASILTGTAVGTILDDDDPPSVSIGNVSVTEGDAGATVATLTVSLSGASGKTVTVDYATLAGTAEAGSDFTAESGTLTFTPGQTSQTVSIDVLGDTVDESDEALSVELSNAVNAAIADGSGAITILDDDGAPALSLSIADTSVTEGTGGTSTLSFTVTLSAASAEEVTALFATSDGSATAPADYASASGTVTFAPGDTSETVSVTVQGDALDEPDEDLTVELSDALGASIDDDSATGTILDDDDPPSVSIGNVSGHGG